MHTEEFAFFWALLLVAAVWWRCYRALTQGNSFSRACPLKRDVCRFFGNRHFVFIVYKLLRHHSGLNMYVCRNSFTGAWKRQTALIDIIVTPWFYLPQSSLSHRFSYESWLSSRGLMLSPFHVRWQTTMFNRLFAYCARINPRALYLWWGLLSSTQIVLLGLERRRFESFQLWFHCTFPW